MKFFGRKKKSEENVRSRKPCEDMVDGVRTRLSKKGIPMSVSLSVSGSFGSTSYVSNSLERVSSKDHKGSPIQIEKIKLEASTFSGTRDDHFFNYTINFPGNSEIELNLQERTLESIFSDSEINHNYEDIDGYGSYHGFYRLDNLSSIDPRGLADKIYTVFMRYDEMRAQVSGLIKMLRDTEDKEEEILEEFDKVKK